MMGGTANHQTDQCRPAAEKLRNIAAEQEKQRKAAERHARIFVAEERLLEVCVLDRHDSKAFY
jgi:hypothetical protein